MRVVALFFVAASATAGTQTPMDRVVELIEGLKAKIVADGAAEQKVYDKYACWCEETTARKAAAIEDAKILIEELSKNILELKGRLGTYQAEIVKLEKDIADEEATKAAADAADAAQAAAEEAAAAAAAEEEAAEGEQEEDEVVV